MKYLCLSIVFLFSSHVFADYIDLKIKKETGKSGDTLFCYSPLENPKNRKCLTIVSLPPVDLEKNKSNITRLQATEMALDTREGEKEFVITIVWEGKGSGLLSLETKGTLFAFGTVTRSAATGKLDVTLDNFSDSSMAEQLDRGTLFNETDPLALNVKTQAWLENVVPAAVQAYLSRGNATPLP